MMPEKTLMSILEKIKILSEDKHNMVGGIFFKRVLQGLYLALAVQFSSLHKNRTVLEGGHVEALVV